MVHKISESTACLIAKSGADGSSWLPLWLHLEDTAGVIDRLVMRWLPLSFFGAEWQKLTMSELGRLCRFLALTHDIGKAIPTFQAKIGAALPDALERLIASGLTAKPIGEYTCAGMLPHALASEVLLLEAGCPQSLAAIVGAHHGKPQSSNTVGNMQGSEDYLRDKRSADLWEQAQKELLSLAMEEAGYASAEQLPQVDLRGQMLLSGLLIMADWISSNEKYFPLIGGGDMGDRSICSRRVEDGWKALGLPGCWEPDNSWMSRSLIEKRFGFNAKPAQDALTDAASGVTAPGIFILEAPMGMGKTEAALAAAEILANRFGQGGLLFALPTQATSNGIFPRILSWTKTQPEKSVSLILAHGGAKLNDDYARMLDGRLNLTDDSGDVTVHDWFDGRKTALLADFVVCTVDQLLMTALKQKHVMLRHLGMSGKVVVVDECHAYDSYMNEYLCMAVRWMGAYGVPVVILSATLPYRRRRELIMAYLQKALDKENREEWAVSRAYPLLTYTDGDKVCQRVVPGDGNSRPIEINRIGDDDIIPLLRERLSEGGCAAVVVNTVVRAQKLYEQIAAQLEDTETLLLHSGFIAPDRAEKERQLLSMLGKPGEGVSRPHRMVVVGTQIIEQSLDLDADLMLTDLCPIDLLLQRIGRLHRHQRVRPPKLEQACCCVMGALGEDFEPGTAAVYHQYLLGRTRELLPKSVLLPDDISPLVQDVYDIEALPDRSDDKSAGAADSYGRSQDKMSDKARTYRIKPPNKSRVNKAQLHDLLDASAGSSEQQAQAAVRDSDPSVEALVLVKRSNGDIAYLPWQNGGRVIARDRAPCAHEARSIAAQRIRLPHALCIPGVIDKMIAELEKTVRSELLEWMQSPWLCGELFLLLDEHMTARLGDYELSYDRAIGLKYRKEEQAVDRQRI